MQVKTLRCKIIICFTVMTGLTETYFFTRYYLIIELIFYLIEAYVCKSFFIK